MPIIDGFERRALFNLTRLLSLGVVSILLLGVIGGAIAATVMGLRGRGTTRIEYREITGEADNETDGRERPGSQQPMTVRRRAELASRGWGFEAPRRPFLTNFKQYAQ